MIFVTLEDETGVANLVVWPTIAERCRRAVTGARLMRAAGELQREGIVIHVVARRLEDLTARLHALAAPDGAAHPSPERSFPGRSASGSAGRSGRMFPSRDFR